MLQARRELSRAPADLERAARLAAQASSALGLAPTPSREQLRIARQYYVEALSVLEADVTHAACHTSLKQLSRSVERRLSRERWAAFAQRLRSGWRRLARVGLAACGLLGGALAVAAWRGYAHPDLLAGRAFQTSSDWVRCEPEKRRCAGAPTDILFHTNEELEPFVRYDLGGVKSLSRIEVTNRRDNKLGARAVPLVVQVSLDGQTWRELARRGFWFDVWRADLPKSQARYLRLLVARRSILHLERVRAWE